MKEDICVDDKADRLRIQEGNNRLVRDPALRQSNDIVDGDVPITGLCRSQAEDRNGEEDREETETKTSHDAFSIGYAHRTPSGPAKPAV